MTKTRIIGQDTELAAADIEFTPDGSIAATDVQAAIVEVRDEAATAAPSTVDYLVGTADGGLSAEIVVGASPGGELGGTWASPTVDATHSGSTHSAAADAHIADTGDAHDASAVSFVPAGTIAATDTQAAVEEVATDAAGALSTHAGAADPHTGYLKESDFDDVDFLVGTATGHTAAEIVVGTTPGGELGGTWASPTVDATHSGSTHGAAVTTHEAAGDPHTGYRLESADHSHASTGAQAGTVSHDVLTDVSADDHHAAAHTASHLPTGTDPVNKFSQSTVGTLDQAIANTETVLLAKVMAANELVAGQMYRFEAWFTKAGTNASSAVIRIRIGTTTLTGTIMATLTPPTNALAVPGKIEGLLRIVTDGAGGTARGELQQFVHLAAVTVTSAINPSTATGAVNTTTANQRVELTFISGNAANTYTFRNAVMYRVA